MWLCNFVVVVIDCNRKLCDCRKPEKKITLTTLKYFCFTSQTDCDKVNSVRFYRNPMRFKELARVKFASFFTFTRKLEVLVVLFTKMSIFYLYKWSFVFKQVKNFF